MKSGGPVLRDCQLCGGAGRAAAPGLLKCGSCGTVFRTVKIFSTPIYPSDLEHAIYTSAKAALFSSALDFISDAFPGKGRLLDIGCAEGTLLRAASERGWKAEGVELDARLADKVSLSGFVVYRFPVEEAGVKAASYEVVTAFEVLSQMEKPAAAVAEIFRILKPGGVLYIREFNSAFHLPFYKLESFFKPFGIKPAVMHNFNFSARGLRLMLERAGFSGIKITNSPVTAGDPYRSGGRLGGFLTGGLKVLYYYFARALWAASSGRVYAGSALIVTASK